MRIEREGLNIKQNRQGTEVSSITIKTKFLKKPVLKDILIHQMNNSDGPIIIEFLDEHDALVDYVTSTSLKNSMDFKNKKDFEKFLKSTVKDMKKADNIRIRRGDSFKPFPSDDPFG